MLGKLPQPPASFANLMQSIVGVVLFLLFSVSYPNDRVDHKTSTKLRKSDESGLLSLFNRNLLPIQDFKLLIRNTQTQACSFTHVLRHQAINHFTVIPRHFDAIYDFRGSTTSLSIKQHKAQYVWHCGRSWYYHDGNFRRFCSFSCRSYCFAQKCGEITPNSLFTFRDSSPLFPIPVYLM